MVKELKENELIEPVILNEDLIYRLGFTKVEERFYVLNKETENGIIVKNHYGYSFRITSDDDYSYICVNVKFVHEVKIAYKLIMKKHLKC